MRHSQNLLARIRAAVRFQMIVSLLMLLTLSSVGAPPSWWRQRGVTNDQTADNYAPANAGQLKKFATAAYDELEDRARGRGGAGATIAQLIKGWHLLVGAADPNNPASAFQVDQFGNRIPKGAPEADNYAVINLGQLKNVAKPFYDRLRELGVSVPNPWNGIPDNYAVANLGQLKNVFKFSLDGVINAASNFANFWEQGLAAVEKYLADHLPSANGRPNPLAAQNNTVTPVNYGLPQPGAGPNNPQTDSKHDSTLGLTPPAAFLTANWNTYENNDYETVTEQTAARLTWSDQGFQVNSVELQRREDGGNWHTVSHPGTDGVVGYRDGSGLLAGVTYQYRLSVSYAHGETLMSNVAEYHVPLFKSTSTRRAFVGSLNPGFGEYEVSDPPVYYLQKVLTSYVNEGDSVTISVSKEDGTLTASKDDFNFPDLSGCSFSANATTETYTSDTGSIVYTEELSVPYLPEALFEDTIARDRPYSDWGDEYDYEPWHVADTSRWRDDDNQSFGLEKLKYKLHINPSVSANVTFYDIFAPDGDDPEDIPDHKVINTHGVTAGGSSPSDSGTFEIDPTADPNTFAPDGTTGTYYVVQGVEVKAFGHLEDPSDSDNSLGGYVTIDRALKENGSSVVRAPNSDGKGGVSGEIWLSPLMVGGSSYVAHFSNGHFTVKDSYGNTVSDGQSFSQEDVANGRALAFFITPNSNATNGEEFSITFSGEDAQSTSLGSDTVIFTNRTSAGRDFTIPFDEASGSRYRKIGLNGRPTGDEKPHHTEESDQEKEETYIDALTLGLRHSTTDVYVPISGSDLVLSARRDVLSEVWNMHSGLRPHERFDRPFGAGWSSNICVNLEISASFDSDSHQTSASYAYVTDQNGARHRFMQVQDNGSNSTTYYVPMPSDARENGDLLSSFDEGSLTFQDRYGMKIVFDSSVVLTQMISTDRSKRSGKDVFTYYGVNTISDRLGNTLKYRYPDGDAQTLIPSTISLTTSNGQPIGDHQMLSIRQDSGRITTIWDPNGNAFAYSYEPKTYISNGIEYSEWVLNAVLGPDGQTTAYGYLFEEEPDQTPDSITNSQPTNKLHLDLNSITDPRLNTYGFEYTFDNTKFNYNTKAHYFQQTGGPRCVSKVTLPGGSGQTIFANDSYVALNDHYQSNGTITLKAGTHRQINVTDAGGNGIAYTFAGSEVFNVGGISEDIPAAAAPKVIYYTTMTVSYAHGSEIFVFDPQAGLALSEVVDYSGNSTTYEYEDSFSPPCGASLYAKVFPSGNFFNKYPDPTSQTNALSQTKYFHYDHNRYNIMDYSMDEANVVRYYPLDGYGRRRNELVLTGQNVVQRTDYEYANPNFPGVVTGRFVRARADGAPGNDLVTQYELDGNGRIWHETVNPGVLSLVTTSVHDRNGNKLSVTDPKNHTTLFEYDPRNRLCKVVYADLTAKSIEYYPNGTKYSETDENNHTTYFVYDALNRPLSQTRWVTSNDVAFPITTAYGYLDAVQPKNSVTDPNNHTTTFVYDELQRLVRSTDALNHTTIYGYDGVNSGAHAFDSSGFKPTLVRDPRGYATEVDYDPLYRPVVKRVQDQLTPAKYAVSQTFYDPVGNPYYTVDPLNHGTTTSFDMLNRPYHVVYADGSNTSAYYTLTGLKWRVVDELGRQTDTAYDGAGRPISVTGPLVDDGLNPSDPNRGTHFQKPVTQTHYDSAGNVDYTINPRNQRWDFVYDERNRRVEEDQPAVWDADTNQTKRPVIYTGYDYVGNVRWVQDARGYATETEYDEANRPVSVTASPVLIYGSDTPVRPLTRKVYDPAGNVLRVTDANLHTTINTYDDVNRLATTTDAANNQVVYGYDTVGNRTTVTDGLLHTTTFSYDGLNRNTKILDPATKATTFAYNEMNKVSRTDALQHATTYGYDLRNRPTTVTYGGGPVWRTLTYDGAGNLRTVTEQNAAINPAGNPNVEYTYDALNRVVTEKSNTATHTYRYDLAGNRVWVQYGLYSYGNGRQVTSEYDALNRLSALTEGTRRTLYAYDLNGNVRSKTLPSTEVIETVYDGLNRQVQQKGRAPNGLIYEFDSLCDAGGNLRLSYEYTAAGETRRTMLLNYDDADRLTGEQVSNDANVAVSNATYIYDPASNRTQKTVGSVSTTYGYNNLNQLTGWSDTTGKSATYIYDANGNRQFQTSPQGTDVYSYDFENRLVSLYKHSAGNPGLYSYAYDYRTRRFARSEPRTGGGLTTSAVVFSGGVSVAESTPFTNTPRVDQIRGSDWGGGVGGILYSLRGEEPSFAHYDRRGDVVARTDKNGLVKWQASYEAGGKRTAEVGTTADRQKANTKEEDPSGLLNEGMRYRDLETGTFITRDPAGFVDGPNLYAYVRQNPWTKFDPEGLQSEHERKWGAMASDDNVNMGMRFVAMGMAAAESLNPFRSDSSIRQGGRDMQKGFAESREILKRDAPPGIREVAQFTMGVGSAGTVMMSGLAGVGELGDSVQQHGVVETGKHMVTGLVEHAVNNPVEFAGEMTVGVAGGKALKPGGVSAKDVTVTSWADKGLTPDLNPGRWVMLGGKNPFSFLMSGLPGPKVYLSKKFPFVKIEPSKADYNNSTIGEVPASSLERPKGLDKLKPGQRKIKEPGSE